MLAIAAVAGSSVFLVPSPAAAHNALVEAVPAKSATLTSPPAEVRLRFLSNLDPATTLAVTDASGASAIGPVRIEGKAIAAPFTATRGGVFTVTYRVPASDGHAPESKYTFRLDLPEPTPSPTPAPEKTGAPATLAARPVPVPNEPTPWWVYIGGAAVAGLIVGGVIAFLRRDRSPS